MLINLTLNARDAIRQGGELTIETVNIVLDATSAAQHPEVDVVLGPYVLLTVRDTGHGMDPETLTYIFEPFFTSKPVGQGTGLGLATVYGIVKQSGGYIWAESEPRHGTTFSVYLPAIKDEVVDRSSKVAAVADTAPVSAITERKTLLVVDDEEMVRELLVRMLAPLGYTCLQAGDGLEALDILQARQSGAGAIDLVISDLVMPRMNGRELAEQLARRYPDLPVLFTSGHTDDEIVRQELLLPGAPFLQKLFSTDVIEAKLRALLSRPGCIE